jgi:hypothetical protein
VTLRREQPGLDVMTEVRLVDVLSLDDAALVVAAHDHTAGAILDLQRHVRGDDDIFVGAHTTLGLFVALLDRLQRLGPLAGLPLLHRLGHDRALLRCRCW